MVPEHIFVDIYLPLQCIVLHHNGLTMVQHERF